MRKPIKKIIIIVVALISGICGWLVGKSMRPQIAPDHHAIIERYAQSFALDPPFVKAVILTESGGRPQVISAKGAIGLMQLRPTTAQEICRKLDIPWNSADNLQKPELNIHLGCYYLYFLLSELEGDLILTLAAYNTGLYRVKKWRTNSNATSWELVLANGNKETRTFVLRVLHRYGRENILIRRK